jgi:uncharacterized membrane protein YhaH (DUF805 family)
MAVSKIRKISSWSLLIIMAVSAVVLGIYYTGGIKNPGEEMAEPVYTGLLLNWVTTLFFITLGATVLFAIGQFIMQLKDNPKSAISSLIVLVLFAAMFFITYSMGSGTPLEIVGYEGEFNIESWLKLTDMWIYSSYILMALIITVVILGGVKKALNR